MNIGWHLGELHAYEQWLTVALAIGPFVLIAIVVAVRRRQEISNEPADSTDVTERPSSRVAE